MSTNIENTVKNNEEQRTKNLPFGHYKAKCSKVSRQSALLCNFEGFEEVICKPLSQEDYANSWQVVLPRPSKYNKQPIHHWSVTLGQLPPHLWSKYRSEVNKDGTNFNHVIYDNIYHYTVSKTEHDNTLFALRKELKRGYNANRDTIYKYVKELDGINSWLVLRALKFLKGHLENDVVYN